MIAVTSPGFVLFAALLAVLPLMQAAWEVLRSLL